MAKIVLRKKYGWDGETWYHVDVDGITHVSRRTESEARVEFENAKEQIEVEEILETYDTEEKKQ